MGPSITPYLLHDPPILITFHRSLSFPPITTKMKLLLTKTLLAVALIHCACASNDVKPDAYAGDEIDPNQHIDFDFEGAQLPTSLGSMGRVTKKATAAAEDPSTKGPLGSADPNTENDHERKQEEAKPEEL